jgi:hypothetical protein
MRTFVTYTLREVELYRACSTNVERMNACRILVRKPVEKRPIAKLICMYLDSIKVNLREMEWYELD